MIRHDQTRLHPPPCEIADGKGFWTGPVSLGRSRLAVEDADLHPKIATD